MYGTDIGRDIHHHNRSRTGTVVVLWCVSRYLNIPKTFKCLVFLSIVLVILGTFSNGCSGIKPSVRPLRLSVSVFAHLSAWNLLVENFVSYEVKFISLASRLVARPTLGRTSVSVRLCVRTSIAQFRAYSFIPRERTRSNVSAISLNDTKERITKFTHFRTNRTECKMFKKADKSKIVEQKPERDFCLGRKALKKFI